MRSLKATLAGKKLTLALTFGALQRIEDEIADPMEISRFAQVDDIALKMGFTNHKPQFTMTGRNAAAIIHIGAEAAGSDLSLEDVQGMVVEQGLAEAGEIAFDYIAAFLSSQPAKAGEAANGEPGKS